MRYSKRYIIMTIILFLAVVLKFNSIGNKSEEIEVFRGAKLEEKIWNPLIAESVNEQMLSILVDNKKLTNEDSGIYMDQNLNIMVPISALEESFNCSTHLYRGEELLIEKRSDEITFRLNQPEVSINNEKEKISSPMAYKAGEYYVPVEAVADKLDFKYNWDMNMNQAVAVNNAEETSILPPRYDLRERGRMPQVKDQGRYGTCWAFASLSALESAMLPEEQAVFAPDHMSLQNSFVLEQADGGVYTMGMAYLAGWQGPVYETEDPYGDGKSRDNIPARKHIQEIQLIDGKDFEKIKEAVFKYGGVQTAIYSALSSSQSNSPYYNSDAYAYCYMGAEKPNHEVLIIGWDDNYARDNFKMEVEGDGAFICQNSWGEEFGNDGVFYVSYYDVNIGNHNVVYTGIEETDNYDNIYQTDLCGWVGQLGYSQDSLYAANVYTAAQQEQIKAAGFYATGKETSYELYVVKDFRDTESLSERIPVASGKVANAGYYTIDFDEAVDVEPGERYAVVLHVTTPGSERPMAIEYAADEFTSEVDLSDGEGYISFKGNNWERTEENQKCNLCLKAYTDNRE